MSTIAFTISYDADLKLTIDQMIVLEQAPDASKNEELNALSTAVEAYEEANGHTPAPLAPCAAFFEVEMFKRRIRQRNLAELLGISEPRLSDLMKGKRELNMDFARRLYNKLNIPADVILTLQS